MQFQIKSRSIDVGIPNRTELEAQIRHRFEKGDGFALSTLNMDHLVKLADSPEFFDAYAQQDLVVADGNPIVWLSQLARKPVQLLPGSDMVVPLAKLAADAGVSVALVGTTDDSLAKAATALQTAVPGLTVAICIAPPFGFDPKSAAADEIFDQLNDSGARLCFIALGAPKQEVFAARGRTKAPKIGFASIGAGLDFLSGSQTRAPWRVRRFALEWLWRLMSDPRRMTVRYARCFQILPGHIVRAMRQRRVG